jgi:uncharacterized protein with von Willebrand factor type A (vWA) domain
VKREEHYDAFEQVFASFFLGASSPGKAIDWEDLIAGKPFQEWLRKEIESGRLPPEAIQEFETEELLARFWETLLAQDGEHNGGSRWVGTRGKSPFGHDGLTGGGIRVHGQGLHGTARKVIGDRKFINYTGKTGMAAENLRHVLASLKSLQPMGPETELDVDETIARTARNGGEIELVFRRELRNRLRLIVLLDNGGYSMRPHIPLVRTVFSKISGTLRDLRTYYFHNCIYGAVYLDPRRTRPLKWDAFANEGRSTRLIIIGDADMAPAELMASYGSLDINTTERKPGWEWLKELREFFPASVWLNPISRESWGYGSTTIRQIGRLFPMEDLTLAGIKKAVEVLNIEGRAVDGR